MSTQYLKISDDGDSTASPGNLLQCVSSQSVSLHLNRISSVRLSFPDRSPNGFVATEHHWESLALLSFLPASSIYVSALSKMSSPRPFSFSLYDRCFNPLVIFVASQKTSSTMSMCLSHEGSKHWIQHTTFNPGLGKGSPPSTDVTVCLMQLQLLLAVFVEFAASCSTWVHCPLCCQQLGVCQGPSGKPASQLAGPQQPELLLGIISSKVQGFMLHLVELSGLPVRQLFLQPARENHFSYVPVSFLSSEGSQPICLPLSLALIHITFINGSQVIITRKKKTTKNQHTVLVFIEKMHIKSIITNYTKDVLIS